MTNVKAVLKTSPQPGTVTEMLSGSATVLTLSVKNNSMQFPIEHERLLGI